MQRASLPGCIELEVHNHVIANHGKLSPWVPSDFVATTWCLQSPTWIDAHELPNSQGEP